MSGSKQSLQGLITYHMNEAAYCRMASLWGWGRSVSFKRMWRRRERYHRNLIKALKDRKS